MPNPLFRHTEARIDVASARERVLMHLITPRCAREIRQRTGLPRKTVESVLRRCTRAGLIACVTPSIRQSRLYHVAPLGTAWLDERPLGTSSALGSSSTMPHLGQASACHRLDGLHEPHARGGASTSPGTAVAAALDPEWLFDYAWVQAGVYRRLVLEHLDEPSTVRSLRRRIVVRHARIGATHVRATLRDFAARRLARVVHGCDESVVVGGIVYRHTWMLTAKGRILRSALRDG